MKHGYAIVFLALALAACSSSTTAPTPAQVQADTAKVIYFLQAAGCVGSTLAGAAAPIAQVTLDQKGSATLTAIDASATKLCPNGITVPAAAVGAVPAS